MASPKVITAPLAVIKVNGVAIGKMKDIRVQESFQRGRVQGIGRINASDKPITGWDGTLSCSFYNVNLKESSLPGALNRSFNTLQDFVDNLLLNEDGVQVVLYKKVKGPNGVGSALEVVATVNKLLIESDAFDLSEGATSGKNQSFSYLDPIIEPV